MSTRTASLLGASGLIGGHLLRLLADDPAYGAITVLTRRTLGLSLPKVREAVVDFDRPETLGDALASDDVFCCLGTTIKKAGSREAFRKVDLEYPLTAAREALARGAKQYLIVTAVGADASSGVFYNRVKGELEDALRGLAFPHGVKRFHPSMLLGDRGESRPAERVGTVVMRALGPLMQGGLQKYRAIDAAGVARAMARAAKGEPAENRVYEGASLFALAAPG